MWRRHSLTVTAPLSVSARGRRHDASVCAFGLGEAFSPRGDVASSRSQSKQPSLLCAVLVVNEPWCMQGKGRPQEGIAAAAGADQVRRQHHLLRKTHQDSRLAASSNAVLRRLGPASSLQTVAATYLLEFALDDLRKTTATHLREMGATPFGAAHRPGRRFCLGASTCLPH